MQRYSGDMEAKAQLDHRLTVGAASAGMVGGNLSRAIEAKSFEGLLNELDKRLSGLRECTNRASEFRHRLLNPRPADTGKVAGAEPSPQTIEGRLAATVRYAESILSDLHEVCTDLDRAV